MTLGDNDKGAIVHQGCDCVSPCEGGCRCLSRSEENVRAADALDERHALSEKDVPVQLVKHERCA